MATTDPLEYIPVRKKVKTSFTFNQEVWERFRRICDDKEVPLSVAVEALMREYLRLYDKSA